MTFIGDFLLSAVPKEDTEFRDYLETESPDGERVIDNMGRSGISLEEERRAFETVRHLQSLISQPT